ncbi:MAG TPA: dihydropteroate synthase [Bdellovibrionota bacterium]|nr:dihydropteroate synthase [Bdellovibrionota bacterium]
MSNSPHILRWRGGELKLDRCRIMGVLNVTPDSFSDGGKYFEPRGAAERAWKIKEEGADILDIGAESTRPGADGISLETEESRLFPVLESLKESNYPLPISLDSRKPEIARRALGSELIQFVNDIEGLRNSKMVEVVRDFRAPVILMHMFGTPETMQKEYAYKNVVEDILEFFRGRLAETGLTENVILDPGIGFGKSVGHNLEIVRRLTEFRSLGYPILVGVSRKSFIGKILNVESDQRLEGGLAASALAIERGASILRTHDVLATIRVARMVEAIQGSKE